MYGEVKLGEADYTVVWVWDVKWIYSAFTDIGK